MLSKQLSVLLFLGIMCCNISSVIYVFWPETAKIEYILWLDKGHKQKLSVLWYIFELSNILNDFIWTFVLSKVAYKVSYRLFHVSLVFMAYRVTQFYFYVWNRNTTVWSNYIVYLFMALVLIYIFLPERQLGKYRDIDDF